MTVNLLSARLVLPFDQKMLQDNISTDTCICVSDLHIGYTGVCVCVCIPVLVVGHRPVDDDLTSVPHPSGNSAHIGDTLVKVV